MATRRRSTGLLIGALACFVSAGALLAHIAWEQFGTNVVADDAQSSLVEAFEESVTVGQQPTAPSATEQPDTDTAANATPALQYGEMFGVLRIPRFGDDYAKPVFEATDAPTLKKGVGHYVGTANACEVGNFALAAHRTTYGAAFREVEALEIGDTISIETASVSCTYAVEQTLIVDPSDTSVIEAVPGQPDVTPTEAYLTLTTCHPLYSAAERYIVHARLIEIVEH